MTHGATIRRFASRFIFTVLVTALLAFGGSKGKSHRSAKNGGGKTQHVSGYTAKTGKHVGPYNRRPPK
jgi:hypothetical protein